jgi:hypothetical protein
MQRRIYISQLLESYGFQWGSKNWMSKIVKTLQWEIFFFFFFKSNIAIDFCLGLLEVKDVQATVLEKPQPSKESIEHFIGSG